jgi:chromosome segregation ATPase
MSDEPDNDELRPDNDGLRGRLQKQGEETLGRVAQELLESSLVHGALAKAFDAREKASQAQEAAMGALNLPSAADLERLTRRVRSLSQRLEGIEDGVDRLDERLASLPGAGIDQRLAGIETSLARLVGEVEALRERLPAPAPTAPEAPTKPEAPPATPRRRAAPKKKAAEPS